MFVYLYILKLGVLDGLAGLYFCALRAAHELNISAKIYEQRHDSRPGAHDMEIPLKQEQASQLGQTS